MSTKIPLAPALMAIVFASYLRVEAADFELYSFPSLPAVLDAQGAPVLVPVTSDGPGTPPLATPRLVPLREGGFSALARVEAGSAASAAVVATAATAATTATAPLEFWTITDRGPNFPLDARKDSSGRPFGPNAKFFPFPAYNQAILRLRLKDDRTIEIAERIGLKRRGLPANGLPSSLTERPASEFAYSSLTERSERTAIAPSAAGYDFEGLVEDPRLAPGERRFWTCEEYGPSLQVFDGGGNLRMEFLPGAVRSGAGTAEDPAVFPLPAVMRHRKANRGFEGLAAARDAVFAILQSPLDPAGGGSGSPGHGNPNARLHRLVRIEKGTWKATQLAYDHAANVQAPGFAHGDVRIGDLAALDEEGREFFAVEYCLGAYAHLYRISIPPAVMVLREEEGVGYESGRVPYTPVEKRLVLDLGPMFQSFPVPAKPEGIAVLDARTIFLAFDNDFGLGGDLTEVFELGAERNRNLLLRVDLEGKREEIQLLVRGDDMGVAHSINEACIRSYREGIVRSVEVIVPGPWFPDAARLLRENPGLDAGVHLCLTSEWENCKWGPLTHAPSLADAGGYFFPMTRQRRDFPPGTGFVEAGPKLEEVEKELRAQIETARRHIPQVSHLSAHMGTAVATPELRAVTEKLAREYGLPLEGAGIRHAPGFGGMRTTTDGKPREKEDAFLEMIEKLGPGRWLFVEHPGLDTPEMRGLGHIGYTDVAADRAGVTRAFTSERVKQTIRAKGIRLISYKDLAAR